MLAARDPEGHKTLELLLQMGGSLTARTSARGHTPLFIAAKANNVPVVTWLLQHGAGLRLLQSKTQRTRLLKAARGEALAVLKTFIRQATMTVHQAVRDGSEAEAKAIVREGGADVNGRDEQGDTGLHLAVRVLPDQAAASMARRLLRLGADPDALDAQLHTPLFIATRERPSGPAAALLGPLTCIRYAAEKDVVLGEQVGVGGHATVYRATFEGQQWAAKVFFKQDPTSAAWASVLAEARLFMGLPGVAEMAYQVKPGPIILDDAGFPRGVLMDYSPGGSLRSILQGPGLSLATRLKLGAELAAAVAELHAIPVWHADVKPENVLLDAEDVTAAHLRLGDFGRAKQREAEADASAGLTWMYRPPETVDDSGAAVGHWGVQSDVYMLGLTLVELLSHAEGGGPGLWQALWSQAPEEEGDAERTARLETLLREGEEGDLAAAAGSVPEDVPPRVAKYLRYTLNRDPSRRPTSAQLLEVLNRALVENGQVHVRAGTGVPCRRPPAASGRVDLPDLAEEEEEDTDRHTAPDSIHLEEDDETEGEEEEDEVVGEGGAAAAGHGGDEEEEETPRAAAVRRLGANLASQHQSRPEEATAVGSGVPDEAE